MADDARLGKGHAVIREPGDGKLLPVAYRAGGEGAGQVAEQEGFEPSIRF